MTRRHGMNKMAGRRAPACAIAAGSLVMALAGCGSTPPPHLLALPLPGGKLGAPTSAQATPPDTAASPALGASSAPRVLAVRRLNIPEYLQADKVRFRSAESTLAEWPNTTWAERLEVGLTDHLVMRLRLALPGWIVCERACPSLATSPVLNVDLAPLDYVRPAGELRADARWRLNVRSDNKDGTGTPSGSGSTWFVTPVRPDSPEGQAAALGVLLDQLAQDIAISLQR